jgi:hypothetical protein
MARLGRRQPFTGVIIGREPEAVAAATVDLWEPTLPARTRSRVVATATLAAVAAFTELVTAAPAVPSSDGWSTRLSAPARIVETAKRAQSSAFTAVVAVAAVPSSDGWSTRLSEPGQSTSIVAESSSFLALPASVDAPVDSWAFPVTEPVRLPFNQLPPISDVPLAGITFDAEPITPTSEPLRQVRRIARAAIQDATPFVEVSAVPSLDSWYQIVSEPVRSAARPAIDTGRPLPLDGITFIAPLDGWNTSLAEPQRFARRIHDPRPAQEGRVEPPDVVVDAPVDSWVFPLAEPRRELPPNPQLPLTGPLPLDGITVDAEPLTLLTEPVRFARRVVDVPISQAQNVALIVEVPSLDSWYQPLAEHARTAKQNRGDAELATPVPPVVIVGPVDAWHVPLSEPVRRAPRIHDSRIGQEGPVKDVGLTTVTAHTADTWLVEFESRVCSIAYEAREWVVAYASRIWDIRYDKRG